MGWGASSSTPKWRRICLQVGEVYNSFIQTRRSKSSLGPWQVITNSTTRGVSEAMCWILFVVGPYHWAREPREFFPENWPNWSLQGIAEYYTSVITIHFGWRDLIFSTEAKNIMEITKILSGMHAILKFNGENLPKCWYF